jgi:iron complex outermembrane receptor protein
MPLPIVGASNTTLSGWQLNLSPRIKGNFESFGTGILGYELNKSSQGSNNSYGSEVLNNIIIPYGYISNPNGLTYNAQNASLLNQSVYGILKLPIANGLTFDGGVRHQAQQSSTYDTNIYSFNGPASASKTYSANAGDAAFNFNYASNQKIYFKWNQSYRFPNIDEFWGYDINTSTQVFNGILKPQTTQTYEIGGNWMISSVRVNGSIFSSTSQNEIMYDPSSGFNYNSQYNVNRRGLVLDSSSNITSKLMIAGGGKLQNSYYADGPFAGNAIPLAPNLLLNARANYLIDLNWSFGGVVNYVSSQHYDASPTYYNTLNQMPSYTVGDVYLNYKTGHFDTKFTIKNVGNTSYATTGGYTSLMGANGAFNNNYYYYPSDRRAFYLSSKYTF